MIMKTFKDLEFKNRGAWGHWELGFRARMDFKNGYGISVIKGGYAHGDIDKPYEFAVMLKGQLCYTTEITNNVEGYNTVDDITEAMRRIQLLK